MENTVYIENMLLKLFTLSPKRYFILYNKNKNVFCFKKGCLLYLKSAWADGQDHFFIEWLSKVWTNKREDIMRATSSSYDLAHR